MLSHCTEADTLHSFGKAIVEKVSYFDKLCCTYDCNRTDLKDNKYLLDISASQGPVARKPGSANPGLSQIPNINFLQRKVSGLHKILLGPASMETQFTNKKMEAQNSF